MRRFVEGVDRGQRAAREMGFNAVVFAPMVRDDKVLGAIATARPGAEPFDERQIALIKAFADQADSGDPDDQQVI